jgi:pyridoxal phosphate enzyme (YggS family)
MAFLVEKYQKIKEQLGPFHAALVAVSKTKPVEDIMEAYKSGIRDFGENYVQELTEKQKLLPADIHWHFIGHLQTNKVKFIAPFVHLIHGIDSEKLLKEINKEGKKNNRVIDCLLQVHISREETKFGFDENELAELVTRFLKSGPLEFPYIRICGLMGMATFTEDNDLIRKEFAQLKTIFDHHAKSGSTNFQFSILSMGMSADYQFALEKGSTMVRIGSLLFGERTYNK